MPSAVRVPRHRARPVRPPVRRPRITGRLLLGGLFAGSLIPGDPSAGGALAAAAAANLPPVGLVEVDETRATVAATLEASRRQVQATTEAFVARLRTRPRETVFGPVPDGARPVLARLAADPAEPEDLRLTAAIAAAGVGGLEALPEDLVPVLLGWLESPDAALRSGAAVALMRPATSVLCRDAEPIAAWVRATLRRGAAVDPMASLAAASVAVHSGRADLRESLHEASGTRGVAPSASMLVQFALLGDFRADAQLVDAMLAVAEDDPATAISLPALSSAIPSMTEDAQAMMIARLPGVLTARLDARPGARLDEGLFGFLARHGDAAATPLFVRLATEGRRSPSVSAGLARLAPGRARALVLERLRTAPRGVDEEMFALAARVGHASGDAELVDALGRAVELAVGDGDDPPEPGRPGRTIFPQHVQWAAIAAATIGGESGLALTDRIVRRDGIPRGIDWSRLHHAIRGTTYAAILAEARARGWTPRQLDASDTFSGRRAALGGELDRGVDPLTLAWRNAPARLIAEHGRSLLVPRYAVTDPPYAAAFRALAFILPPTFGVDAFIDRPVDPNDPAAGRILEVVVADRVHRVRTRGRSRPNAALSIEDLVAVMNAALASSGHVERLWFLGGDQTLGCFDEADAAWIADRLLVPVSPTLAGLGTLDDGTTSPPWLSRQREAALAALEAARDATRAEGD